MNAATVVMEERREPATELDAAQAEHDQAMTAWRDVQRREHELTTGLRGTAALDELEREAALDELRQEKEAALRRALVARERLVSAKAAVASDTLAELAPKHENAVEAVEARLRRVEQAAAVLVGHVWKLSDLRQRERRLAEWGVQGALAAAPDDEAREMIRRRSRDEIRRR